MAEDQEPVFNPKNYPGSPYRVAAKRTIFKRLLVAAGILLALSLAGLAAWKLIPSKKTSETAQSPVQTETDTTAANTTTKDVPDASGTELYENGFLGIKITHPSNWKAEEAESGDAVRIVSPDFSYETVEGTMTKGNFRIYLRKGARDVDSKYIGRGVAIQPSEKLVYKDPALGQRTETNLTLFGLDTADNFSFFLIAGNFELKTGDTLGPNYGKESETYIVGGGFSSPELADDLATNSVTIEMTRTSNAYKQALEILKSLQLR